MFLLIVIVSSLILPAYSTSSTSLITEPFSILGTEYYEDMPVIRSKDQLNYSLSIDTIAINTNELALNAQISKDGETIADIIANGKVYLPENSHYKQTGGYTILLKNESDITILSCLLEEQTDAGLFFPANSDFNLKPTITIVAQDPNNNTFHFSGILPDNFNFKLLAPIAVDANENIEVTDGDLAEKMIESSDDKEALDEVLKEPEVVDLSENYHRLSLDDSSCSEEPIENNYDYKRRLYSPVPGVPSNVFTTRGMVQRK